MTSIIVWAVCFTAFVLAYIFVLSPQKQQLNEIRSKLAQRQSDFNKATDAFTGATKQRLDQELGRLRSKSDNFVLLTEDSSKLVTYIGRTANELNVQGFSSKQQSESSGGGQATLPQCKVLGADHIYISFKGSFQQFARFINEMERHKPVLFVDKFSITRSENGGFDNDINMSLSVFVCPQSDSGSIAMLARP